MVPIVHETPGRYDVIIRVARDGGQLPDPVTFAVAADQAASRRSASIISVHMADTIINVVTVTAPDRYAATAVARNWHDNLRFAPWVDIDGAVQDNPGRESGLCIAIGTNGRRFEVVAA